MRECREIISNGFSPIIDLGGVDVLGHVSPRKFFKLEPTFPIIRLNKLFKIVHFLETNRCSERQVRMVEANLAIKGFGFVISADETDCVISGPTIIVLLVGLFFSCSNPISVSAKIYGWSVFCGTEMYFYGRM